MLARPRAEPLTPAAHGALGNARVEGRGALGDHHLEALEHSGTDRAGAVPPMAEDEVREECVAPVASPTEQAAGDDLVHDPGLADLAAVAAVEGHHLAAIRTLATRRRSAPAERRVLSNRELARPRDRHAVSPTRRAYDSSRRPALPVTARCSKSVAREGSGVRMQTSR